MAKIIFDYVLRHRIKTENIGEVVIDIGLFCFLIFVFIQARWLRFQYCRDVEIEIDTNRYGERYINGMLLLIEEIAAHKYSSIDRELLNFA